MNTHASSWLVHRDDIGALYTLALERGEPHYNGAGVEAVAVGLIAQAMAHPAGVPESHHVRIRPPMSPKAIWRITVSLSLQLASPRSKAHKCLRVSLTCKISLQRCAENATVRSSLTKQCHA
jgi:hypothetical protein